MSEQAAKNRQLLMDYLSNPDNPEVKRTDYSKKILGYKQNSQIYKFFTPAEINEIEWDALQEKRKRYAPKIAKIDNAMITAAEDGNANAGKLCYQRFENWSEKSIVQHGFDSTTLNAILSALPTEYADAVKAQLAELTKK